jgi:putative transposase
MYMTDNEVTYFHVYNRGVEKRPIFQDQQDYGVYLSCLKEYLSLKNESELREELTKPLTTSQRDEVWKSLRAKNYHQEIELLAYCLMPNHFHLFIRQNKINTLDKFMRALNTKYAMYFNIKYKRVGHLFQGGCKSVAVTDESQFLHLSCYIHKQALSLTGVTLQEVQPSSFLDYVGERKSTWVHPELILDAFADQNKSSVYREYVVEALRGVTSQEEEI